MVTLMAMVKPPEHIEKVLRRLAESGNDAYLVGGCVRDSIIGRPVHDWDVASPAAPGEVESLFRKTVLTGEKYGTVTVVLPECSVEVTTFRSESGYLDGRRPSVVGFEASLEEDLSRRDFTMNAIAVSVSGVLVDPFCGAEDIENRIIRCVGAPDDRFAEDALRMFRAYRFSAELGFDIEPATLSSIGRNADKAALISAERVRMELEKTLLSQKPEISGEMIRTGLLSGHVPTSGGLADNLSGLADSLGRIAVLPAEAELRWCAFCSLLKDHGLISSVGAFLRGMRLDSNTIKICKSALSVGLRPGGADIPDRAGIKKLLSKHGADAVRCAAAVYDALYGAPRSVSALRRVEEVLRSGECFSLNTLAVNGSDLMALGCPPGWGIGKTLSALLDHVIGRPEDNTREALVKIVEESRKM